MMDIKGGFVSMVYKFFDKKSADSGVNKISMVKIIKLNKIIN